MSQCRDSARKSVSNSQGHEEHDDFPKIAPFDEAYERVHLPQTPESESVASEKVEEDENVATTGHPALDFGPYTCGQESDTFNTPSPS